MEVQEYTWVKNYPNKIPHEISGYQYETLTTLLERAIEEYGPLPAFECMGSGISYDELDKLTQHFAAYLQQELGLNPGARIAIQLPNTLQYPVAMLGALRAGLIVVNTNPLYTSREMKYQFMDAAVEAIVILANYADKLETVLPETVIRHVIITEVGDLLGGLKKQVVNGMVKHIKKMVPKYNLPFSIRFSEALKSGSYKRFYPVTVASEDIAFLQYTGDTTGISKGAQLTHGNLIANIEQFSTWIGAGLQHGKETVITAMPLYHIMALMGNCFTMMKLGGSNILITDPRDTKALIKTMRRKNFSIFSGVNTLYNSLLNHPDFLKIDFEQVKFCAAGGMAVKTIVADRWRSMTGYGLTETSPILTFNIPLAGKERVGTVGLPLPSTEIMIANEAGYEVPVGELGEIYAKGPQVMAGYWNNPEETAKVFTTDGWFKTGDIGLMDQDGFFKVVDRKKEMILVSGFNVYPNEVEEVACSHPKVLESGAIGVADDKSSEVVKLFVVKKDPSLSKEELLSYCIDHLAPYKIPRHIEFREQLPKTNVGKVLRRQLMEEEILRNI
jgi:long-chain acyl-CoA synthetase